MVFKLKEFNVDSPNLADPSLVAQPRRNRTVADAAEDMRLSVVTELRRLRNASGVKRDPLLTGRIGFLIVL